MIGEKEIIRAIASIVKSKFNGIEVYDRATKEGFKKTCFFIEIINPAVSAAGEDFMEEELSVRLTYFPITEQDTKDLYSVKATLQQVFYLGFWVNSDFHITLEEPLQFNYTANGNLEMLMALHMIQDMPEEDGEMMEELDIDFREE